MRNARARALLKTRSPEDLVRLVASAFGRGRVDVRPRTRRFARAGAKVEAEKAQIAWLKELEEQARQKQLEREAEERKREEIRRKEAEAAKLQARLDAIAENERKTKAFFDVDQGGKFEIHTMTTTTTGGVYFGDHEVLGDDWRPHGFGEFRMATGEVVYEGEWVRGARHGTGTWFFEEKDVDGDRPGLETAFKVPCLCVPRLLPAKLWRQFESGRRPQATA